MTTGAKLDGGRASTAWTSANVTVGAGWGDTAALVLQTGTNDSRGMLQVTTGGSGQAAAPTLVCTFNNPAGEKIPVVVVTRADAVTNAAGEVHVTAQAATGFTITFDGTPTGTEVYKINFVVVG